MRIVEVTDSGYENGLRAGKAVAGKWKPAATMLVKNMIDATRYHPSVLAPRKHEEALANLQKWTQEDMLNYAAALHQKKMAALPDLRLFPELKGMDQYLDDEARGFAQGAGIDVREVYLERYWREIYFHALGHIPLARSCSEFYFVETPQGPLLGKGWDDTPVWYREQDFPVSPPPQELTLLRQKGVRGYSYVYTVNEVGLCYEQGGGAMYEREEDREEILFPAPVVDILLRRCATVDQAVGLLTRYNIYWGPCNSVVGDAEGRIAIFEKSKYSFGLRRYDGTFAVTTYGGCDDPKMRSLCNVDSPLFHWYERRVQVMREVVEADWPNLSLDTYWRSVLHHDPIAPGCQHEETRPQGVDLITMGCFATLPREERAFSRVVVREGNRFRYACTAQPVESTFSFQI